MLDYDQKVTVREFKSVHSYSNFVASVRARRRYIRDPEQTDFLAAVLETSTKKREVLPKGCLLYRAQLGCEWPEDRAEDGADNGPVGYAPSRMKPLRDRAIEGRVNPREIPCLYMATHSKTAAAEVRPWMGAYISIAQMKTTRDLALVNCTSDDRRHRMYLGETTAEEREVAVWRDIDRAFAEPAQRIEDTAEYAPTQIIAEVFRDAGLDGVGYRSSLGPGHNLAAFDLSSADVISCTVERVRRIDFDMLEVANRYFVSEHHQLQS